MIVDTITNHNRIIKIINDYWNKEGLKNVVDIRYVCEFNHECNCSEIKGVRINNIYLSCNQLEKIIGVNIVINKGGKHEHC